MSDTEKCRKCFVEALLIHLWVVGEVSIEQRDSIAQNFEKTSYFGKC